MGMQIEIIEELVNDALQKGAKVLIARNAVLIRFMRRNAYGAQNVFLRSIGASTVNINRTLSRPPYSNTNLKQRLFPAVP